ncbi:hypothetical protein ABKN59_005134 [Abortiporus biennis]
MYRPLSQTQNSQGGPARVIARLKDLHRRSDEQRFEYVKNLYKYFHRLWIAEDPTSMEEIRAIAKSDVPLVIVEVVAETLHLLPHDATSGKPDYESKHGYKILIYINRLLSILSRLCRFIGKRTKDLARKSQVLWSAIWKDIRRNHGSSVIFPYQDPDDPLPSATLKHISVLHKNVTELAVSCGESYYDENRPTTPVTNDDFRHVLIFMWLCSRSQDQFHALELFLRTASVHATSTKWKGFFQELNFDNFSKYAVRRFIHDLRYPHDVDSELGDFYRTLLLEFFSSISSNAPSKFVKEAFQNVGNVMRSVTIATQEAFCQDRDETPGGECSTMIMLAITGLSIMYEKFEITSVKEAKKFVRQPETAVMVGQALFIAFYQHQNICLQRLGDIFPLFLKSLSFLLQNRSAIEDCRLFLQHIEAAWQPTFLKLGHGIPDKTLPPGVAVNKSEINKNLAIDCWMYLRNSLLQIFGTFNDKPDLPKYRRNILLIRYCNWKELRVVRSWIGTMESIIRNVGRYLLPIRRPHFCDVGLIIY